MHLTPQTFRGKQFSCLNNSPQNPGYSWEVQIPRSWFLLASSAQQFEQTGPFKSTSLSCLPPQGSLHLPPLTNCDILTLTLESL